MKHFMYVIISFIMVSASCQHSTTSKESLNTTESKVAAVNVPAIDGLEFAYFASGCFWCVEAIYEHTIGVKEVISGYAGGHAKNPTYASSNTGKTGHAETVQVQYDPKRITFEQLIDVYFASQNPTQFNGQGPDHGSQYRSILFYQDDVQKKNIEDKITEMEKALGKQVAAEVMPFQKFWKAEVYHQDFEKLHPNHSYIKNVSVPRLLKAKAKLPELIQLSKK